MSERCITPCALCPRKRIERGISKVVSLLPTRFSIISLVQIDRTGVEARAMLSSARWLW